jgi:hypothetical protein
MRFDYRNLGGYMGFLEKALKAQQRRAAKEIKGAMIGVLKEALHSGPTRAYETKTRSPGNAHEGNVRDLGIALNQERLKEIDDCVGLHRPSERVLYTGAKQHLNVVGESFHQEALQQLLGEYESESGWCSGFLLPEPSNRYDSNAVAVILIDRDENDHFSGIQVGYLPKEVAVGVQGRLLQFQGPSCSAPYGS